LDRERDDHRGERGPADLMLAAVAEHGIGQPRGGDDKKAGQSEDDYRQRGPGTERDEAGNAECPGDHEDADQGPQGAGRRRRSVDAAGPGSRAVIGVIGQYRASALYEAAH
jgi:hypothetical protein